MSWENSYSKKLPALTSLRTLVVSRFLGMPYRIALIFRGSKFSRIFDNFCDTHAHAICGRGKGPSPKKIRVVHETRDATGPVKRTPRLQRDAVGFTAAAPEGRHSARAGKGPA